MKSVLTALLLASSSAAFAATPVMPATAQRASASPAASPASAAIAASARGLVSLNLRDTPLHEVFDLLSRQERVNIVLGKGVTGTVSVNLYNVEVKAAIRTIAEAAGYAIEMRNGNYLILDRKDADLDAGREATQVRTFKVQYSNPKQVADILSKYLSRFGKITPLVERNVLVVEDLPAHMNRVQKLLAEIDVEPRQIMIEAKILEITLDRSEVFGIDWSHIFGSGNGSGGGRSSIGTTGLAPRGISGLVFNVVNRNLEIFLAALSSKGRVNTLSTPKLLALENQEASAVIGDRIGYKVTTTINQVTTESIQFLETGVILRVTPSVDQQGRIMLSIHPEVSSASVAGGIPSKKSTEVTTQLLCEDGQSVFIGGLIKSSNSKRRTGVPVLGELPYVGRLLSNTEEISTTTETIVVITPRIIAKPSETIESGTLDDIEAVRQAASRAAMSPEPAVPAPVR